MLKYYRDENRRHPAAHHTALTRDEMVAATRHLCREYDLPELPVYFSDRPPPGRQVTSRHQSWFYFIDDLKRGGFAPQRSRYVSYGVGMLTALTVAHEVAHYVRHEAYRRDLLLPWVRRMRRGPTPRPGRDHDHRHAAVVARALRILRAAGFVRPDGVEAIKAAKDRYLKRIEGYRPDGSIEGYLVLDFQALPKNAWLPGSEVTALTGTLEPA